MESIMYTYAEKSKKMLLETVDALRNKPVNSTYLERLILADKVSSLYVDMPQPLRLGYCMNYVAENASCPVMPHDILVGRFVECVPTEDEEKEIQRIGHRMGENQLFMCDGGHTTFDWEEILHLGISGLIRRAESELEKKLADGAEKERVVFLQGMILVYQAYRRYIARYAEAAAEAGLTEAANACRNLADNPPRNFFEGMQLILFVTSFYSIYSASGNATLTCGRMDDLLASLYEQDVASGELSREDAGYIIDDFNCKSAIILGRGEHQMSGGTEKDTGWLRNPMYDSPTYVILGGYSRLRDYRTNPLTQLFLERIHPRLENPVYVFRRTGEVDETQWSIVCDKLRENSTLLVYNDETVIPALIRGGVEEDDAINYTIHGCNWPDIPGMSVYAKTIGGPLPRSIMESLWDSDGRPLPFFSSMESVYEKIMSDFRACLQNAYHEMRAFPKDHPPVSSSLSCTDCFMRGTIESATSCYFAVKYRFALHLLRNIGTAADMMASIEQVLFGPEPVTPEYLSDALKADFAGYEALWKRCRNAPKFGQDDDRADRHAVRLMTELTDIIRDESVNSETGVRDIDSVNVTITDMGHIGEGSRLGATPDGRKAGAPLSENLSPTVGSGQSVTALLNSVSKIPFDRFSSGALNVRMPKNLASGDAGLTRLIALLETYFENGGMQVQLSVTDTAELQDAQKHPEKYPDLMVRITGYSAVFVDMCRNAQNEIIRRDEVS